MYNDKRITLADIRRYCRQTEPIACLTAYDSTFAKILESAGVDVILVGDSLGMVMQGRETTLAVTMADIIYHCVCVNRAVSRPLIMADMPFMSYTSVEQVLYNAGRLIQEGGAQMVKLESGESQVDFIRELSICGIASCAHLGLRPQWIHKLGDYSIQANNPVDAARLEKDAHALAQAGADILLLECIPHKLAAKITENVGIPTIGIGAGRECNGQILVTQDILGMTDCMPGFAKNFLTEAVSVKAAITAYVRSVKDRSFPDAVR